MNYYKTKVDMQNFTNVENWKLAYIDNSTFNAEKLNLTTPKEVAKKGLPVLCASVPGNFELDFMREGILEDVYFGANFLKTYRLENLHFYYFTTFELSHRAGHNTVLSFEGIDTVAEIFVDGKKLFFYLNYLVERSAV